MSGSIKPILFSGPMVRALLDGRKTQTRRIIKPQPFIDAMGNVATETKRGAGITLYGQHPDGRPNWQNFARCCSPYGWKFERLDFRPSPAGRLWVREAHYLTDDGDHERVVYAEDAAAVAAHLEHVDECERRWPSPVWPAHRKLRPSIHMPRWASRLTLTITDVRVQRLQDISEADAQAEGVRPLPYQMSDDASAWWEVSPGEHQARTAAESYRKLWTAINGAGSWQENPWVWAVSFEVHHGNVGELS